jgi:hypothetical protein
MSINERITEILSDNDEYSGIITEPLYNALIEAIRREYSLRLHEARKEVTNALRGLYGAQEAI